MDEFQQAVEEIDGRFIGGNSIPVERATVLQRDWAIVRRRISELTDSPKLPTFEEVDSHVGNILHAADGYDDWQRMAVREAYSYMASII